MSFASIVVISIPMSSPKAHQYLRKKHTTVMITVFKDKRENWHLVKGLGKAGLSISITSYCGDSDGGDSIKQVPDNFLGRICKSCQKELERL